MSPSLLRHDGECVGVTRGEIKHLGVTAHVPPYDGQVLAAVPLRGGGVGLRVNPHTDTFLKFLTHYVSPEIWVSTDLVSPCIFNLSNCITKCFEADHVADLCPTESNVPPQFPLRLGPLGNMALLPDSLTLQTKIKVADKTTISGEKIRLKLN